MRVDKYLTKEFKEGSYNCWDFAREVWLDLTGVDLGSQTPKENSTCAYNEAALRVANTLKSVPTPISPCLVLMQRSRLNPHVGVFYNSRVLHLDKNGAQYLPLDQVTSRFTTIGFYK